MRRLADERRLTAADVAGLGVDAAALLREWFDQGWIEGEST
jgi:50S ribosomal protein L16 3-hydroxylase